MLLIKAAPIEPAPGSVPSSPWLLWRPKEVDNIGDRVLLCVCVSVCVCQISFFLRGWCVIPFHPAMATGSRERLHSSRSGAHHWEDEKLPTEPPTSQPQKATMSSYLSFLSPFTEEGKRRGLVYAVCHSILTPYDAHPCNLGPAERREPRVYYLMSQSLACNGWLCSGSGAGPSTCGCVSGDPVVDAGSGLLVRSVSIQLHLKRSLKVEAKAHLSEA